MRYEVSSIRISNFIRSRLLIKLLTWSSFRTLDLSDVSNVTRMVLHLTVFLLFALMLAWYLPGKAYLCHMAISPQFAP